MNPRRAPERTRGFTLVELLIVISVLAVLVALSAGAASKAITAARISRSSQNLKQLVAANHQYAADHGTFAPADDRTGRRRWHGTRSSNNAPFDPARGFLSPYLGETGEITRCPLMLHIAGSDTSFEQGTGGYGYNSQYIGGRPGGAYETGSGLRRALNALSLPRDAVMFATTAYARAGGVQDYPFAEPPFWDFGGGPSGSRPSPTVHFRANGRALVGWTDGRVTAEEMNPRDTGDNPHGGNADELELGWFGPDEENGYWNPHRTTIK